MGCACKVDKQINKIHNQYGVATPMIKTNIKDGITTWFKKIFLNIIFLNSFLA